MTQAKKTLKERFLHAFLFEILAIGLCAPVAAWAMGKSLFEMGVLTAVIAWIALVWNMIYNAGFDRLENRYGLTRNLRLRVIHAFGFELGLILIVIPLAAWWLNISLWQAFVLDIALVLFYLPYAFSTTWPTTSPFTGDPLAGTPSRRRLRAAAVTPR